MTPPEPRSPGPSAAFKAACLGATAHVVVGLLAIPMASFLISRLVVTYDNFGIDSPRSAVLAIKLSHAAVRFWFLVPIFLVVLAAMDWAFLRALWAIPAGRRIARPWTASLILVTLMLLGRVLADLLLPLLNPHRLAG